MPIQLDNPIQMAVIGAAHGIKGELRVKSFTGDPLALRDYSPLFSEDGRTFEIAEMRMQKDMAIVRFKGVKDRDAAEALTGTPLFVDRDALPEDLDDEEFYHADLVGLNVSDIEGAVLGRVIAVQNFGGGDILEVSRGRGTILIPFTRAAVPTVDLVARTATVDPEAAGLVDTGDEPESHDEAPPAVKKRPRGPKSAGGNQ